MYNAKCVLGNLTFAVNPSFALTNLPRYWIKISRWHLRSQVVSAASNAPLCFVNSTIYPLLDILIRFRSFFYHVQLTMPKTPWLLPITITYQPCRLFIVSQQFNVVASHYLAQHGSTYMFLAPPADAVLCFCFTDKSNDTKFGKSVQVLSMTMYFLPNQL